MKRKIALFDFDGTLSPGDSVVPFLLYSIRRGWAPPMQLFKAVVAYIKQRIAADTIVNAKSVTLSYLKGRTQAETDAFSQMFFREKLADKLYQEGIAEIERLHKDGVEVVVVSASAEAWMRALPQFLPVDMVLATQCELDEAGRYTGKVLNNCRGEEKVRRVYETFGQDIEIVAAYGDSKGDIPMLQRAKAPRLVNPKRNVHRAIPKAVICRWRTPCSM